MSPKDQRIEIAEAYGFTCELWGKKEKSIIGWKKDGVYYSVIPDYLNDLNAIREIENTLSETSPGLDKNGDKIPSDKARYRMELCIMGLNNGGPIHTSAAQRAEAFLKTIGKWSE